MADGDTKTNDPTAKDQTAANLKTPEAGNDAPPSAQKSPPIAKSPQENPASEATATVDDTPVSPKAPSSPEASVPKTSTKLDAHVADVKNERSAHGRKPRKAPAKPAAKRTARKAKAAPARRGVNNSRKTTVAKNKERTTMATNAKKEDITADVRALAEDVQAKARTAAKVVYAKGSALATDVETKAKTAARTAYAKGSALAVEAGEMSKHNAEALASSAKILGQGMKDIGEDMLDDSRSALSTIGDDVKTFASIKSPAELFKLQGDVAARNFDALVAFGTKNGKAMRGLAGDMFAPLTARAKANYQTVRGAF